ncbi:MAG: potassium channel family protein, partial [Candidatus Stygibacter australis]|nr:potassium channel family protein [Candidatus Stygibacter australis]
YHPDNFQETKFGSETINRIIKFYPAKITFDNVNYHVDESISKEKFALGRNLENVNFAERVIYRYLGNIDLEIINSDLNNVILGDLCTQIIIKNSVIENLEIFGRKDNILILEENTLKNLTINRPNNLILKSNNIEKKFNLQPSLNDSINNNITLEDNEFQEGINFDWDVLKTMNLNVSEGPNKAERMISMYSTLKKSLRRRNRLDDVDDCHYASHDYLRKNYWKDSDAGFLNRIFKTLFYYVDWISTGYGTQPLRIFPYALVVIFVFAFVYFLKPDYISNLHEHIEFENIIKNKLSILTMDELRFKFKIVEGEDEQLDKMKMIEKIIFELPRLEIIKVAKLKFIKNKIILFGNCFYFSFCTFTTIGVGDWYPRNILSKCLVMIEGALGWISLGLFITSYGNLLLR